MRNFAVIMLVAVAIGSGCTRRGEGVGVAGEVLSDESAFLLRGTQVIAAERADYEKAVFGLEMLDANGNIVGYCTAVLIRPDVILTAAHCFNTTLVKGFHSARVQATTNLTTVASRDPGARTITKVILHPNYDSLAKLVDGLRQSQHDHDIAVGILDRPVDAAIAPQPLIESGVRLLHGQRVLVYGFGKSVDYDEPENSNIARWFLTLQKGILVMTSEMLNNRIVTRYHSPSSLCQGDSGGPGFYLPRTSKAVPTVVTINSASRGGFRIGVDHQLCHGESVMQPVAPSREWIDRILRENGR